MVKKEFKPVSTNVNFPKLEEEILAFWDKDHTFEKSVEQRPVDKEFTFYDGPPFATGLPHYGHHLQGTMKDVIPRYWTMKGYRVERRFGWDCHGLPVEYELEKELGLSGKADIEKMGVDKFNEQCRVIVLRYTKEWGKTVHRMGRWIDFRNDYKTMDPSYMESIWWVFKSLWEKGLIYEGRKSMHICPRCATPLSNFEVSLGYKDVSDLTVTAKFKLLDEKNTYVLAWTTTPWTLPGNVLVAVNPKFDYVKVSYEGNTYILAKERVKEVFKDKKGYKVLGEVKVSELVGKKYEPLFSVNVGKGRKYEVVEADFVTLEEGTGVVHIAPAFGDEDATLSQKLGAAFFQHINKDGKVNELLPKWQGKFVLSINEEIIKTLASEGKVFGSQRITHSYPHCWRCETPLLNYSTQSWFVKVTQIKDKLVGENKKIHWVPAHVREGRFGKWLEGARDWAISRNRYWGTPLPVWKCDKCGEVVVVGSIDELAKLSGARLNDLHKHFTDKVTFPCKKCKGIMRIVGTVLDCWFESGSMPYAYVHYPFENKERFEKNFPADFIGEALDQTRGWFYTLHVLAVALFGKPAFWNVTTTGLVLAEDGQKMSKRKKNYPDPEFVFDKYGADTMRFYMMNSPVVRGEDLRFSEKGLVDLIRNMFLPYWNSYAFFVSNASYNKLSFGDLNKVSSNTLDKWILARLAETTKAVTYSMDRFDLYAACKNYQPFVDDLSKWFVRRSRDRIGEGDKEVMSTINKVLVDFTKLLSPFAPFMTESVYKNLTGEESVHLSTWPEIDKKLIDKELLKAMSDLRLAVEKGHALRKEKAVRTRQPLRMVEIEGLDWSSFDKKVKEDFGRLVKDELNVKEVKVVNKFAFSPSADGSKVNKFAFSQSSKVNKFAFARKLAKVRGDTIKVTFDFKITEQLRAEGEARDLVRQVQGLRKGEGMKPWDKIAVYAPSWPSEFASYIKKKTNAVELKQANELSIKKL